MYMYVYTYIVICVYTYILWYVCKADPVSQDLLQVYHIRKNEHYI